jgi:hypothetical protein
MRVLKNLLRLRHLYLPLLLVACGMLACNRVRTSDDFWAHAAVGRWIWENEQFPHHTLFLWTEPQPWIAHSWLSQLVCFAIASNGEDEEYPLLIMGFTMVMAALPFVLLWCLWWWRAGVRSPMIVYFWMAMFASVSRFVTRPELFTALCYTLLLLFLGVWSREGPAGKANIPSRRDKLLGLGVALMFVLWVNLHGAVAMGLVIFAVTVACDFVQDQYDRRSFMLAAFFMLCVAAVTVNPYGVFYWQALLPVRGPMFAGIAEWRPLWEVFNLEVTIAQLVLLAVAALAWRLNPARRWSHLAWLTLMAFFFANAVRNTWLLAITSLTVAGFNSHALHPETLWRNITRLGKPVDAPEVPGPPESLRWLVRAALLVWIVMMLYVRYEAIELLDLKMPTALRDGGIRYLAEHDMPRHMFNDYENSPYLLWHLQGKPLLFIDLLNAYPEQYFLDYRDMIDADRHGRKLFDEHEIGCIILTTNRPGPTLTTLATYLEKTPTWVKVYAGYDSMIWVRKTPENEPLWRKPRLRTEQSVAGVEWLGRE